MKVKKTTVRRTKRTDQIIHLRQTYEGNLHRKPAIYNAAFANVLRQMADRIEKIDDAWVCPEVVIWLHQQGLITSEVMLSPIAK